MFTDRSFLLERQYRTAQNLNARIELHERFSTNPEPFPRWVFDRLRLPSEADIPEVGCGNGNLWAANRDRIPAGWRLPLTDSSRGMIDEARERLGDLASYGVADVQEPVVGNLDKVVLSFRRCRDLASVRRRSGAGGRRECSGTWSRRV